MTAECLDQVGLILGFISGLLLIPEVFSLLPLAKMEKSLENQLIKLEHWMKFPLRFGPPSWKIKYTEEQREGIEPLTAIRTLIFSVVWIALLVIGILLPSMIFVLLGLVLILVVVIGNLYKYLPLFPRRSIWLIISLFLSSLLLITLVTPLISLIRVIFLIMGGIVATIHNFFSKHDVLRNSLIIVAILFFILSNILQFWATLL